MTLILLRVDERLIHGQVVVGWAAEIRPDHYVVVDDDLAASVWEQELYVLGLPDEASAEFVSVREASGRMVEWDTDSRRVVLLTKGLSAMAGLSREGGLDGRDINLGGLHHAADRIEVLPYLHVGPDDLDALATLRRAGARVTAQDLPATKPHGLDSLLESE